MTAEIAMTTVRNSFLASIAIACSFTVSACGAPSAQNDMSRELKVLPSSPGALPDCLSASGTPANKLIRGSNAIPGEYIVALLRTVHDVTGTAKALAAKYGGQVTEVYTSVLHGFAVKKVDDASAPLLADEPSVCWVQQNATGVKPTR